MRSACRLIVAIMVLSLVSAGRQTVRIVDMQYSPATVNIDVGDSVSWLNADDRDHTVVADDNAFRSGNIPPGGSFSHTFKKPGRYAYGCKYHPRMRGTVVVK